MRTIIVPSTDYRVVDKGGRITFTSYASGLENGDKVRIRMRDHCSHEGLRARVAAIEHNVRGGVLNSLHVIERDD